MGLTEQSLNAARKVKFVPAMIDGHPVNLYIQLEYNFDLILGISYDELREMNKQGNSE
jgi:hypothetical protein